MQRFYFSIICYSLCISFALTAANPPPPQQTQKTIPMFHLPKEAPVQPIQHLNIAQPEKKQITSPPFALPGVVGLKDNQWIGSDNLMNLSQNIEVFVEIAKPEGKNIPITEESLKDLVSGILSEGGINPHVESSEQNPPLPLYHVLILINSIPNGFVAYCSSRLFEEVQMKRVILSEGTTFQAITWEKQDLLIAAEQDLPKHLQDSIKDMATEFKTRFQYFQNLKEQMKK